MASTNPSVFRIDDRVFTTMFVFCLLFSLLFLYSYSNRKSCEVKDLQVKAANFYVGSVISFRADAINGENYSWDFGDQATESKDIPTASHDYERPGKYRVSVIVNGKCQVHADVVIMERPLPVLIKPEIVGPGSVEKGSLVKFSDATAGGTRWEWFFDDEAPVATEAGNISHKFLEVGLHQIRVRVNGNSEMVAEKMVEVKDGEVSVKVNSEKHRKNEWRLIPYTPIKGQPSDPPLTFHRDSIVVTPTAAFPAIEADEMEALLQGVVTGAKTVRSFSRYLCATQTVEVQYNGENITLEEMCKRLASYRKLSKIEGPVVTLQKDKVTGCLQSMIVTVNKTGLIGRIKHKLSKK